MDSARATQRHARAINSLNKNEECAHTLSRARAHASTKVNKTRLLTAIAAAPQQNEGDTSPRSFTKAIQDTGATHVKFEECRTPRSTGTKKKNEGERSGYRSGGGVGDGGGGCKGERYTPVRTRVEKEPPPERENKGTEQRKKRRRRTKPPEEAPRRGGK